MLFFYSHQIMPAKKNILSSILAVFMKVINHYVVKSLIILFFAIIFVVYGTLLILDSYTHHGESITVPDVSGLLLEEAAEVLLSQNMRWQLLDSSIHVSSVKPGSVFRQNPDAGSAVKKNRNIFLTVNPKAQETVRMPNVVNMSLREARSRLEQRGLKLGETTYIPDIAKDYVLKQQYRGAIVREGEQIAKGARIDLVLGNGNAEDRGIE